MMRTWTITSALSHLRAFVEGPTVRAVSQEDIQSFVVTTDLGRQRRAERQQRLSSIAPAPVPAEAIAESGVDPAVGTAAVQEVEEVEEMEVSGPECESPSRDIPPADQEPAFPPSLLSVPVLAGSDSSSPDLRSLPPNWLPIISGDQAVPVVRSQPYSDAYLSGQPSKRRKLNAESKPRGDVGQLLHQSLQEVGGVTKPLYSVGVRPLCSLFPGCGPDRPPASWRSSGPGRDRGGQLCCAGLGGADAHQHHPGEL